MFVSGIRRKESVVPIPLTIIPLTIFFRPVHPSAFASFCLEGRVKGGRNISDNPKNFGHFRKNGPFPKLFRIIFSGSATVPVAVRRVSRRTSGSNHDKFS